MLAGKALLDYNNLFPPNDYEKNDKIIYNYFKGTYSGQFLANESPLKLMKNPLYFTLKALFVLKIFAFLS